MKDLVVNTIKVGDLCYYLKVSTSVRVCIVEILKFQKNGIVCKVIKSNPTDCVTRGCNWSDGYVTKPLAKTNLIRCNINL